MRNCIKKFSASVGNHEFDIGLIKFTSNIQFVMTEYLILCSETQLRVN
jgi:hypothetical protein